MTVGGGQREQVQKQNSSDTCFGEGGASSRADDASLLGVSPIRDVLIHCSGPEEEEELVGRSSDRTTAWLTSSHREHTALCVDSWPCH